MWAGINPNVTESPSEIIMSYGVNYTREKLGLDTVEETVGALCRLHPSAHNYFRYAVAKKTMEFLHRVDLFVEAGYLVGESDEKEIPHQDPLTIVVAVKRKTAALNSLVDELSAGLLAEYKRLVGDAAADLQVFVLFELMDWQDLQLRQRLLFDAHLLIAGN
ncbi:MAG: hypothetical protein ACOY9Y_07895 [Bacillota bacterium]